MRVAVAGGCSRVDSRDVDVVVADITFIGSCGGDMTQLILDTNARFS